MLIFKNHVILAFKDLKSFVIQFKKKTTVAISLSVKNFKENTYFFRTEVIVYRSFLKHIVLEPSQPRNSE